MKRLHIIGRKNHGKTTLVSELVAHWKSQGLRVGTLKHTHHRHELDTPGKDSFQHRKAGAEVVGILSQSMNAVFWEPTPKADGSDRYDEFLRMFAGCDVVLVEGDSHADSDKIEVWRSAIGTRPLAEEDESILAVVTDDAIDVTSPVLSRSDISELARFIRQRLGQ